jgi:hypothetical protein
MNDTPDVKPQILKKADAHVGIIHFVTGKTANGQDCHVYISVRPSLYEDFCHKMKTGEPMNLEEFGKILHKGLGLSPDEDERHYLEDQFGIDHTLVKGLELPF